jgi:hypothetical protein
VIVSKPWRPFPCFRTAQAEKKSSVREKVRGFFSFPLLTPAVTLHRRRRPRTRATGDGPESFEAQKIRATVIPLRFFKPVSIQLRCRSAGPHCRSTAACKGPKDFFKGERSDEPEKLTLKAVGVDLTASVRAPARVRRPVVHSGTAEGAITVAVEGTDRSRIDGGMLNQRAPPSRAGIPRPRRRPSRVSRERNVADRVVSISKFEFSSPWLRANASGTLQPGDKTGC